MKFISDKTLLIVTDRKPIYIVEAGMKLMFYSEQLENIINKV